MRILYGVVGEGMGHATRSRVVVEHLSQLGHQILVVVSGKAHVFLRNAFNENSGVDVREIEGLHLVLEDNQLDVIASLRSNLERAPASLKKNIEVYRQVAAPFDPEFVVSDFESFAHTYARMHDIPVVSIDNMQILNRCALPDALIDDDKRSFQLAKWAVKAKVPGAYHYLVTTFFAPPVRKPRTTLMPPILRPAVTNAKREPSDHIVVYQTGQAGLTLLPVLKTLPGDFRMYGAGDTGVDGNVTLRPFSETGFIDDLRTARAVIANAGFSLSSEAVHLGVPMLAVPVADQFEQTLNARALQHLGYGRAADELSADAMSSFLSAIDDCQHALEGYERHSNDMLFDALDHLIRFASLDEPAPESLSVANLGTYDPHRVDEIDDDEP